MAGKTWFVRSSFQHQGHFVAEEEKRKGHDESDAEMDDRVGINFR